MKKHSLLFTLFVYVASASPLFVHNCYSQTYLTKVLELTIDTKGGANGACVAWHPGQKKYYAAMAGNETFQMAVFNENGKLLSDTGLTTLIDVRGLWYNPNTKTLQANGYSETGWGEYELGSKGIPTKVNTLFTGLHQPGEQSVGAYDYKKNGVIFFNLADVTIDYYNFQNAMVDSSHYIYLGCRSFEEADVYYDAEMDYYYWEDVIYDYNENAVIYTGIPGSEIGLLNTAAYTIELYNQETGFMTQSLQLPEGTLTAYSLNFSYSNGIYWLFDTEFRKWVGYK